ncbi:hypothetical protein V6N13_096268 [Hibiscus sabdariffa]
MFICEDRILELLIKLYSRVKNAAYLASNSEKKSEASCNTAGKAVVILRVFKSGLMGKVSSFSPVVILGQGNRSSFDEGLYFRRPTTLPPDL